MSIMQEGIYSFGLLDTDLLLKNAKNYAWMNERLRKNELIKIWKTFTLKKYIMQLTH